MAKMTAEEEEEYKYRWRLEPYDTAEGRANAPQWLLDKYRPDAAPPPPPPRFPSPPDVRRQILNAIATGNEKYARPFDRGKVAIASFIGTESWADYGNVVLQMAILDTLLAIEEKLASLTDAGGDDAPAL